MNNNLKNEVIEVYCTGAADDRVEIHFSLETVVDKCYELADKIEADIRKNGYTEINLIYIRNGGTFPGELISMILEQRLKDKPNGVIIHKYNPHYGRYHDGREGQKLDIIKDYTDKQKGELVETVNRGVATYIIDELTDDGVTLELARDLLANLPNMQQEAVKHNVKAAVLYRKPNFFKNHANDSVSEFVQFYTRDYTQEDVNNILKEMGYDPIGRVIPLWLVLPWEEGSKRYNGMLNKRVYSMPVETLITHLKEDERYTRVAQHH